MGDQFGYEKAVTETYDGASECVAETGGCGDSPPEDPEHGGQSCV